MIQLIKSIYLATTIAALIAFTLNYKRMNKYLHKIGLQAVFNEDSLVCLLMYFIPILNIFYGISYWNGAMWTDKDFEEYFCGVKAVYEKLMLLLSIMFRNL